MGDEYSSVAINSVNMYIFILWTLFGVLSCQWEKYILLLYLGNLLKDRSRPFQNGEECCAT